MKKFENKVAIVTGATSGIGRQVAYQLAEGGAKVVVCGRNQARGQEVVDAIAAPASPPTAARWCACRYELRCGAEALRLQCAASE